MGIMRFSINNNSLLGHSIYVCMYVCGIGYVGITLSMDVIKFEKNKNEFYLIRLMVKDGNEKSSLIL